MEQKENQLEAGEKTSVIPNNTIERRKSTVVTEYEGSGFAHMTFKKHSTIGEVVEHLLNPTEEDLKKEEELKALYEAKLKAEKEGKLNEAKALDEEYKRLKACYFSSIAFAGKFEGTTCRKEGFVQSSNFIAIDIDHIPEDKIEESYEKLKNDEHTIILYKTASGLGLRVVFISSFSDEDSYRKAELAIRKYLKTKYGLEADEGAKNINRLMKLNPNGAYVNWEAKEFIGNDEETKDIIEYSTSSECIDVVNSHSKSVDPNNIPSYVSSVVYGELNSLNESEDGERNTNLNKAAFNLGQYEHYELYTEDEIYELAHEISLSIKLDENEIRNTFNSGWNSGKKNPVYLYKWEVGRNGK